MRVLVVLLTAASAVLLMSPGSGARRLSRLHQREGRPAGPAAGTAGRDASSSTRRDGPDGQRASSGGALAGAAAMCGAGVAVLLGGLTGVLVGAAVGVAAFAALSRLAVDAPPDVQLRDLPLTLDLLSACVVAGAAPVDALDTVGNAVGGVVGERLRGVARATALGAAPDAAWGVLAAEGDPPALRECAARFARAESSGAAVASALDRLATDLRRTATAEARARASRAGVLTVGPLGICFLPAFVVLGVVPMVAGLVAQLPL